MKKRETKYLAVFIYGIALISVAAIGALISVFSYASESPPSNDAPALIRLISAPAYTDISRLTQLVLIFTVVLIPFAGVAAIWVFRKACSDLGKTALENTELRERNAIIAKSCGTGDQRVQLLTKLTGRIALEFCNLITPVVSRAHQLRSEVPAGDPAREDVEQIYGDSRRALDILQQFVVIGGGWRDNSRTPLALQELMPQIVVSAGAGKPDYVEIIEDYEFKDERVMGNQSQLHNAFNNLCANSRDSIDTMRAGDPNRVGHIWLRGYTVLRDGVKYARVCVEDDGAGIDGEHIAKIFDPFFTTKASGEGAGLGLTIVKNIAENHGGAVGVSSASGKGAVFTVDLPVIDKEKKDDGARAAAKKYKLIMPQNQDARPQGGGNIKQNKIQNHFAIRRGDNMPSKLYEHTHADEAATQGGNIGAGQGRGADAAPGGNAGITFKTKPGAAGAGYKPGAKAGAGVYGQNMNAPERMNYSPYERQIASQRAARSAYRLKVLRGGAGGAGAEDSNVENLNADNAENVKVNYESARAEGLARGLFALKGGAQARRQPTDSSRVGINVDQLMRANMDSLRWSPSAAGQDVRATQDLPDGKTAPSGIVVVDGQQAVLNTIHSKLTSSGYEVRTFENPFEALEAIKEKPCKVLIAANKMKHMSGATLAELVKGAGQASHILLMLDNTDGSAIGLIRKERIDGFLMKPISANELLDKLSVISDI